MGIWKNYYDAVEKNFPELGARFSSMGYWRDYLFFITVVYVLPLCFVAIIPGIFASISAEIYEIIIFDCVTVVLLSIIAFNRKVPIRIKKSIFLGLVYVFAVILFKNLGSYGPGLMYLLAVSIFSIFIFPDRFAFYTLGLNTLFCTVYGAYIYYDSESLHFSDRDQLLSWFAVSSNFIFLNAVFALLIPRMFRGMQQMLESQVRLRERIDRKQQELEESLVQLERKNEELEQFAFVASHDLQEPLRMITGFLTKVEAKYNPLLDEKGKSYIKMAVDGAERMRQIILDLLQYARVDRGVHEIELVDLHQIVEATLVTLTPVIKSKNAEIAVDSLPRVYGSEMLLGNAMQNLIENALKYCPEDRAPRIHISCTISQGIATISVADNGIGIEEEYFDKIFIIFQRLHDRSRFTGTGIGLAIVKKVVESLGGSIWLRSEVGNGTVFSFTLKTEQFFANGTH